MRQRLACKANQVGLVVVVVSLVVGVSIWQLEIDRRRTENHRSGAYDLNPDNPGELELRLLAIKASTEAKRTVARELILHRLDLLAAAARIREIERASPHFNRDAFQRLHPTATDEERYCREAIEWVRAALLDSGQSDKRVRELEQELAQHLLKRPLRLPEGGGPPREAQ